MIAMSSNANKDDTGAWTVWSKILPTLRYEYLVAGVAGGTLSTLAVHPFDLLKIRLSVNDGKEGRPLYRGLRHAARSIWRTEGIRGFYQGVTPNCIGSGTAWGLYFVFYNATKTWMNDGDSTIHLGPVKHMQAAIQAGMLTLVFTNPIFVVKTRMCLRYGNVDGEYGSFPRAMAFLYRSEGIRGFYKGFVPGLIGTSHGAVQFMVYEEMKKWMSKKERLSNTEYLIASSLSKAIAVVCTYPYQVVRSRLQDQHRSYNGNLDVIQQTFKHEGMPGFYKGLVPNILRVTPAAAVTFLVYENTVALFTGPAIAK